MEAITPKEFNDMFDDQKSTYLWDNGIFVSERFVKDDYIVKSYSLLDFYVDVYYSLHDNKIETINALETEDDLNGLLSEIKLIDYL